MMAAEDQLPPETETKKPNKEFAFALKIKSGEVDGHYLYCMEDDKFYHYEDGFWKSLFFIDFLGRMEQKIPEIIAAPLPVRKQICENFKTIGRKHIDEFNWTELINLKNGMLSPYSGELDDHDPVFYSTNRLNYIYNEESKCELWLRVLNEILEEDKLKIGALQEFFGYCLTRDTKQHKALLLLGESRSGKSTILQTLRNVIGINNCSSVPLKFLNNPQCTAMLMNKLVNIDTDVSAKAVEFEAEFKTITSGEPVHVNQKFIAPFDFMPYCKMVMAANIFPKITDHSSAFYNRLILIPCDRVFSPEEQDRDLPKKLMEELPGILNWSIAGLKRLTERGRFEELEFMREAVEELENENNPVNLFFEEFIKVEMGTILEKGILFEKYKKWAQETNNYPLSKARFASCVFKRYHHQTPKCSRMPNSGKRVWLNIQIIDTPSKPATLINWND